MPFVVTSGAGNFTSIAGNPAAVNLTVTQAGVVRLTSINGLPGPAGPAGPAGNSQAFEYTQIAPSATWIIPVPVAFARRPAVDVYLTSGEQIIADTVASASSVSIMFASPTAGSAVLT